MLTQNKYFIDLELQWTFKSTVCERVRGHVRSDRDTSCVSLVGSGGETAMASGHFAFYRDDVGGEFYFCEAAFASPSQEGGECEEGRVVCVSGLEYACFDRCLHKLWNPGV